VRTHTRRHHRSKAPVRSTMPSPTPTPNSRQ
jgi:hypothetical protein